MKSIFINKKRIVICIIIVVVLVAVGVVSFSFITPKSISGDWELVVNPEIAQSTPDEVENQNRVYYTFSKPNEYGEGTYKTYYDSGVEEGEYNLSEKDGKKLINLGTEDLEYNISGSKLFGKAKLVITYPEHTDEQTGLKSPAQDYVFEQAKAPEYEKQFYDTYKTDESLIGKWVTSERTLAYYMYDLSYTETIELLDSGIMKIHYESADLALDRYMYYAYTADNGKLTFSSVTDKETQYTVSYDFDEKGNLKFTEDNTQGSIFADEFFSSVTYYPAENIPEASADKQ